MIEIALRTWLLSRTPITALVASRVHVDEFIVESVAQLPALSVELTEDKDSLCVDGTAVDLRFPTFEIQAWGATRLAAKTLLDVVRRQLLLIGDGTTVSITANGAPRTVKIEQVDLLNRYQRDAEEFAHAIALKPEVQLIRVGWRDS